MIDFKERRNRSWLYAIKLIRLIASGGGFPILVGLLFILSMFAYAQLLQRLTPSPLILLVLAFLIAWVITNSPIRTWIQSPDLVFLMPMEQKLVDYFWACLYYNLLMQCLRTGLFFMLLLPIYRLHIDSWLTFWFSLIILTAYQALQTLMSWYRLKFRVKWAKIGLCAFHLLFVYLLLMKQWILLTLAALIVASFYYYLQRIMPFYPWPWLVLIAQEQKRVAFYQRIAGWFIDLPKQKQTMKPRKYLIALLRCFEKQPNPLRFLYWRRFIRDRDYLFPYLYGLLVTLLMMLIIQNPYAILFIFLFSLTLFAVQFVTLAQPSQYPIWLRLYPKQLATGLSQVSMVLLGLQTTLLALIAWVITGYSLLAISLLIIGWIFTLIYSLVYLPYKERQQKLAP